MYIFLLMGMCFNVLFFEKFNIIEYTSGSLGYYDISVDTFLRVSVNRSWGKIIKDIGNWNRMWCGYFENIDFFNSVYLR